MREHHLTKHLHPLETRLLPERITLLQHQLMHLPILAQRLDVDFFVLDLAGGGGRGGGGEPGAEVRFVGDYDGDGLFGVRGGVHADVGDVLTGFVGCFEAFEGDIFTTLKLDEVLDPIRAQA